MKGENVVLPDQIRTRPIFAIVAVLGTVLLVLVATIVAHNLSTDRLSVLEREIRDSLHAPGFALITLFLFFSIHWGAFLRRRYSITFTLCMALAVIAEGSQFFGSRDADIGDLATDILGICTGLLIAALIFGGFRSTTRLAPYRPMAIVCGSLLSLLVVYPLAGASYAIAAQRSAFPQLADFEARWEKRLYSGSLNRGLRIVPSPNAAFQPGDRTALLDLGKPSVPGLEFFPYSDWTGFEKLLFTVVSASTAQVSVTLRIHDRQHNNEHNDRYNQLFVVPVDPLIVRIPLIEIAERPEKRELDLANIEAVIFFVSSPTGDERIYIDNIHLD